MAQRMFRSLFNHFNTLLDWLDTTRIGLHE
jgi:hypothetical protein